MSDVGFGRTAAVLLSIVLAAFAIALAASPGSAAAPGAAAALEDIERIHDAIERHRSLVGRAPRDRGELGAVVLAQARAVEVSGGLAVDPWGAPYSYHPAPETEDDVYALYSIGANGVDEGGRGDDIAALETVDRSAYPELYRRERGALALFPILMVIVFGPLLVAVMKLARRSLS